jgi:DNA ligase D-like protein (predicted 3'-phosphoesterase)
MSEAVPWLSNLKRHSSPERVTAGMPTFVIQKHAASTLHYDFRLEVAGTLKSWAVPKGPSTDPREKRLAVPVEDHPLGWGDFEGVISEGHYGAGAVIVWDRGTYRNETVKDGEPVPMERALEEGHATFWLEGEKLRGGYALTRVGMDGYSSSAATRRPTRAATRSRPSRSRWSADGLWRSSAAPDRGSRGGRVGSPGRRRSRPPPRTWTPTLPGAARRHERHSSGRRGRHA